MGEVFRQERTQAALNEPMDARILRLHRYYVARSLCVGRDVLDLQAGDGSGAAVLAQVAHTVCAWIGDAADREAARKAFAAGNLRLAAPIADWGEGVGVYDVIVAFDAPGLQDDLGGFLERMGAALRPGGAVVLAARFDRLRPDDLVRQLTARFGHARLLGHRGLVGAVMLGAERTEMRMVAHRGPLHAQTDLGLGHPDAVFCVASDTPVVLDDSVFVEDDPALLAELQARAVQAGAALESLRTEHAALVARVDRGRSDADWRHELAVLRVNAAAAESRLAQATAEYEQTGGAYLHVLAGMQAREAECAALLAATATHAQNLEGMVDALRTQLAAGAQHIATLDARQAHGAAVAEATQVHVGNIEREGARLRDLLGAADVRIGALETERDRLQERLQMVSAQPLRQWGRHWAGRVRRRLRVGDPARRRIARVLGSSLFDPRWYMARYPDVAASGVDPARHYVLDGAREGRNPGPAFDAAWYVLRHPGAVGANLSPLEHYELYGRIAGWLTQPGPAIGTAGALPLQNELAAPGDALPMDEPDAVVEPVAATDEAAIAADAEDPVAAPVEEIAEAADAPLVNPQVLYVSAEADTPGSTYRCSRYAAAVREAGWTADWRRLEETGAQHLVGVRIVVLWRVRYSRHVANIEEEVRRQGGLVVFDVDDLMFRPELARIGVIDGIRTINAGVVPTRQTFAQVQEAMASADVCTTTTEELAGHMRAWQKAVYVLPNGFDDDIHDRGRRAVRVRGRGDGLIRIGYAAGTLTHQKDFLVALPGIVRLLQARAAATLVLFRVHDGPDLVLVDEFEELLPYLDRIEWRDRVGLEALPAEIARFDINIAPLELGNPFCEAKSELKYFEAALVDVPTVASATGPFARAIVHGQTGLLARSDDEWYGSLLRLVDDPLARRDMGRAAYLDCLWRFGPRRRAELVGSFLEQVSGSAAGARAFALDTLQARDVRARNYRPLNLPEAEILHRRDRLEQAQVTVVIPCYNYADYIIDALESVRMQTLDRIDLVVVDDCSSDPLAAELIVTWARRHERRFNRLVVLRHVANSGLSAARNSGFLAAETPFVMPLDADNRLRPNCCAALLATLQESHAAYAYPSIRMFAADDAVFCNERYQPARFVGGNYIDAMAMIAKWAWAAAGGYDMPRRMGWEDFDLWCRLAELGQRGIHVAQELADYRVHGGSMVAAVVEVDVNKEQMVELVEQRHDWLRLSARRPVERV